jgi:hypothetical protein
MENHHNNTQNNIPLVGKFYELYRLSYLWLKNFPKKQRYTLGERIETAILDNLSEIFYLNNLPNSLKENHLLILSAKNEIVKIHFRLALDIGVLNFNKYANAQAILQETGKMIGGWIKFSRSSR